MGQEVPPRFGGHRARRGEDLQGEPTQRLQSSIGQRLLFSQRGEHVGRAERGELGRVDGETDVAAIAGSHGEDEYLAGDRVEGGCLEQLADFQEAVQQLR